jgi:uracil-DNA glycosylase family 4
VLSDVYITATVRCAPPANKPSRDEHDACRPWLEAELDLLSRLRVVVALGAVAWSESLAVFSRRGHAFAGPRPRFAHGVEVALEGGIVLLASYHPSQQNTFTGKLTEPMFDSIWARAREVLSG